MLSRQSQDQPGPVGGFLVALSAQERERETVWAIANLSLRAPKSSSCACCLLPQAPLAFGKALRFRGPAAFLAALR